MNERNAVKEINQVYNLKELSILSLKIRNFTGRDKVSEREIERERDKDRERQRVRETERERETKREIHRERQRERE